VSASRTSNPSNSRKLWVARMAGAGLIAGAVAFGLAGTANAVTPSKDGCLGTEHASPNNPAQGFHACRSNPFYGSQVNSVRPDRVAPHPGYWNCYATKEIHGGI
jgi:hypothetical protein